jgi:hypothetical protein
MLYLAPCDVHPRTVTLPAMHPPPEHPTPVPSWTERDFDTMSWHDNHVHAMRVVEGEHGAGELVLDLDYILEWMKTGTAFQFRMVPVHLRFTEVTNLRIALDYAAVSAALSPFSIQGISRRAEPRERYTAQCWVIGLNWPEGEIRFEASGFEQKAWGAVTLGDRQVLAPAQRVPAKEAD